MEGGVKGEGVKRGGSSYQAHPGEAEHAGMDGWVLRTQFSKHTIVAEHSVILTYQTFSIRIPQPYTHTHTLVYR